MAKLIGVDFSEAAIKLCLNHYDDIAEFKSGDIDAIPKVDIIICSNVLDHFTDDLQLVEGLLERCKLLYVAVPYKEWPLSEEHVRSYDKNSFHMLAVSKKIFKTKGWTEFGVKNLLILFLGNMRRVLNGKKLKQRILLILFEIESNCSLEPI